MAQPGSSDGSWLQFELQRQHSLSAFFPSSPQPDFSFMSDAAIDPPCTPSPTQSFHSLPSVQSASTVASSSSSQGSSSSFASSAVFFSPLVPIYPSASPPAVSFAAADHGDSKPPRKQACVLCRHSKVSCNGQRPCDRCVRLDRAEVCVNPVKKPRKHALLVTAQPYPSPALRGQEGEQQQQRAGHSQLVLQQPQPQPQLGPAALSGPDSVKEDSDSAQLDGAAAAVQLSRITLECMRQQLKAEINSSFRRSIRMAFLFRKLHSVMQPADVSLLIHTLDENTKSWRRGVMRLLLRTGDTATDSGHECGSRVCKELCAAMRRILVMRPVAFTFVGSPSVCSDEAFHCKYPTLILRMEAAVAAFRQRVASMPLWPSPQSWPLLELPVVVQVNRAFEVAFGMDQRAVRQLFVSQSFFALFLLFMPSEWQRLVALELMAESGSEPGYQASAMCRHRLGSSFRAFLDKTVDKDDEGVCIGYEMTFIPIKQPDKYEPLLPHTPSLS